MLALTPSPHTVARVATRSTIGSDPILSCVPTNGKVGGWDWDPDLKMTTKFSPFYYPISYTVPSCSSQTKYSYE